MTDQLDRWEYALTVAEGTREQRRRVLKHVLYELYMTSQPHAINRGEAWRMTITTTQPFSDLDEARIFNSTPHWRASIGGTSFVADWEDEGAYCVLSIRETF